MPAEKSKLLTIVLIVVSFFVLIALRPLVPDVIKILSNLSWFFIPFAIGYVVWHGEKQKQRRWFEHQLLRVAASHHNRLTPTDVSIMTTMNVFQAGRMLEDLQRRGKVRLVVNEEGEYVYEFWELPPHEAYMTSRSF